MKATEFQIGDWVLHFGEIAQIAGIRADNSINSPYIRTNLHDFWYELGHEGIEPIPLTAKILEANGFELVAVGDDSVSTPAAQRNRYEEWVCKEPWLTLTLIYDRRRQTFTLIPVGSGVPLREVHELQHILRLLGIENEIVIE